jgi:ABC-type bacteriocin/lantibiotic exporter with double-glycine peptidase domain
MSFSIGGGGLRMGPRGAIRQFGQEEEGKLFDGRLLVRMLAFLRPYRRRMVLAMLLMLVATGLTLLTPYLMKVAFDDNIALGDMAGLQRTGLVLAAAFLGL